MSILDTDALAAHMSAQDDAYAKNPKPKEQSGPADIFTVELGDGPVPPQLFRLALSLADGMAQSDGDMYRYVRHLIGMFANDYKPGKSPLHDAIARMCIPLLGLTRLLDHIGHTAVNAQANADNGTTPATVRFADAHALLQRTQGELLDALKATGGGHHLTNVFINFLAGGISEHERAVEFFKDVPKPNENAFLLGAAADVVKEGAGVAQIAGRFKGFTTDHLATKSTHEKRHDFAKSIGGVYLRDVRPVIKLPDGTYSETGGES